MIKVFLSRNHFWLACLAGIICLATIRSHPVYGKIDFYLLNGRPWWPKWKTLVTDVRTLGNSPVYTDYVTGSILGGIFGEVPLLEVTRIRRISTLDIDDMEKNKLPAKSLLNFYLKKEELTKNFKCVINLIGYESSWVPDETGHWNRKMGRTSAFYKFRDIQGESNTLIQLKAVPLQRCAVYFANSDE